MHIRTTRDEKYRREKESYVHFIRAHQAILSPARAFPPELLGEIFFHCLDLSDDPRNNSAPWAVSQVCRWWRSVALSTPSLWNRAPMLRLTKRTTSKAYASFLESYLYRSADLPLSFYVAAPFPEYEGHPVLEALIPHSQRWKTVTLEVPFVTIQSLSRVRGRLSTLRTLQLKMPRVSSNVPLDIFEIAPKLRKVTINGLYPRLLKLPWSQLTQYMEKTLSDSGGAAHVLREASRLTVLRMDITADCVSRTTPDLVPVTLHHLHTLRLNFQHGGTTFGPIIASLTIPAIQELRVSSMTGNIAQDLISLVERSQCSLRRLAIHSRALRAGDITRLLALTPLLQELELSDLESEDIKNLTIRPGKQVLVPSLQSFIVRTSRDFTLDAVSFNAMARSRCDLYTHAAVGISNEQMNFLRKHNVKRLKSVRIMSSIQCSCLDKQEGLEGWTSIDYADPKLTPLLFFRRGLLFEFPQLDHENYDDEGSRRNSLDSRRLDDIFVAIEDHPTTDVKYLYRSRLYLTMYEISRLSPQSIPADNKYKFRARAAALIEKWKGAFIMDLPNRRWMTLGRYSVVYVPVDDKLRSSPDALRIVFGSKETYLHEIDMFWPSHI
ncbi:hypothetical protein BDQ17DRAFT_1427137 [Cyathus striatus]|nr:hypothetical protein BDQ17DRAFT_1427137 [Cyathus striatus]